MLSTHSSLLPEPALRFPDHFNVYNLVKSILSSCNTDPVATKALSRVVISVVGNSVHKAINWAGNEQPNWFENVLEPVINDYATCYPRVADDDTDTVAVVSIVVLVAYDILYQRWATVTAGDHNFIINTFSEYLDEQKIRHAVLRAICSERDRLIALDVGLKTCSVLSNLIADVNTCDTERGILKSKGNLDFSVDASPGHTPHANAEGERVEISTPTLSTSDLASTPTSPSHSHDVYVQLFLKPGCALEFCDVDCAQLRDHIFIIDFSTGQQMHIEEGVTLTVTDTKNTVLLRAPSTDGYNLSATMIIPRGHSYIIRDDATIALQTEILDWATIETQKAVFWIGNGPYSIETCGDLTAVVNVEHENRRIFDVN